MTVALSVDASACAQCAAIGTTSASGPITGGARTYAESAQAGCVQLEVTSTHLNYNAQHGS
jgi:hypothetical protein